MKTILIIGSEGFIGGHCVNYFLENNYKVFGCDLVDYSSHDYNYTKISRLSPDFDSLFDDHTYDYCINAAGNGSVPVSIEHPITDFEANCLDVIRILELIRKKTPGCKYLHISSAAVYGNPVSLPVDEEAILKPLSPYGWHKLIAENICAEYSALYNLDVAVVRPFSVYGPGLRKQLFWDLHKKSKQAESEIVLWGDGSESRDFIYIDDLVKAIATILAEKTESYMVFNLASGVEITIKDVVELFYKELNVQSPVKFNHQSRIGDPKNWRANINKLKQIGFRTTTSIEQGTKLTAEWIRKSS
jgi:UDP-glucose 4-epimerase